LISSQHFPQGSARSLETFKIGYLEISLSDWPSHPPNQPFTSSLNRIRARSRC
jgi:hypothetical protein